MKKRTVFLALTAVVSAMLLTAGCSNKPENPPDVTENTQTQPQQSETNSETSQVITTSKEVTIQVSTLETEPVILGTTAAVTVPVNNDNQVVRLASSLLGIPFAENGSDPDEGFDNSGFIYYVLRENGFINCPRQIQDQAVMGTNIGYEQLKSGDLAFFCTENSGNPDFGGIYIGEGQLIYSPMPGQTVKTADINSDYWRNAFVTGVSLS